MTAISVSTTITTRRRQLVNVRQHSLLVAKSRVLLVAGLFAATDVCALARIAYVGVVEPAPRSVDMAEALTPQRGDIVDRNGVPLARAFQAYSLWFNPEALGGGSALVHRPEEVARALVDVFPDMDEAELIARLKSGKPGYLRRRILPEHANRLHALGEPALEFPRENERFYPQGSMAAHVLGFVSSDGHGRVGMEEVFDERLTDPVSRAQPAVLSLDARVQGALEDELGRGMIEANAKGAAGIILDVDTGEVVALASLPSFDPNLIDKGSTPNIFNRVTNQVYELGSAFKPITVAAALDAGTVADIGRRYPSSRPLSIGGFQIRDSHAMGGSLNVAVSLIHSSNVVTAQMPFPTVAMQGGAKVAGAMPMPLASAAITTVGLIDIATVMPMPQVSTEVTKTESVSVAAAMPMAQVIGYGGALISATISGFTSRATITSGSTFNIAATLPLFEVSMQVTKGETISIEALMPMLTKGPFGRITAVMPMAQVSLIGHAVVAVTYEAYAVNLIHKGVKEPVDEVTRYTNFPFERIVRYNNSYFGVAADGLYLLEGTTDHATPATQIPWEFKTHMTDFENPKEKTIVSAYFGGRLGKAETITLYAGEKAEKAYKYKTARGSTAQNHREKFGRGIKARYFAIGANGADGMELDNIEFNIHTLTRRI